MITMYCPLLTLTHLILYRISSTVKMILGIKTFKDTVHKVHFKNESFADWLERIAGDL